MKYYFSIFLRRLPWFLIVATLISALAVTVAVSLPPAYVSQMRLIFERAQIPGDLLSSTVNTSAAEEMQLLEQELLTRANLLDIARRLNVLKDQDKMTPDEIVSAMRSRTRISQSGANSAIRMMTISFEAPTSPKTAEVLNEYLTLILKMNSEFRVERAGSTQQFFEQDLQRLAKELEIQSGKILEFKTANSTALPESLNFRLTRQSSLEERLGDIDREIASLADQRTRMVEIFESTGRIEGIDDESASPQEKQLNQLRQELENALLVYAPGNPKVRVLQTRVAQLEAAVQARAQEEAGTSKMSALDVELAKIDTRVAILNENRIKVADELASITQSIDATPVNAIALEGLQRDYNNTQRQYNDAVGRLATANSGERIELAARGPRINVIEQPTVPNAPTKPNRLFIAGAGSALGMVAGLALVVLLELLNSSARRPFDLVKKLGITPIATIPYVRTEGELLRKRSLKLALILVIVVGIPIAVYAIHMFYMPLDLLAERIMNKLGVRL